MQELGIYVNENYLIYNSRKDLGISRQERDWILDLRQIAVIGIMRKITSDDEDSLF